MSPRDSAYGTHLLSRRDTEPSWPRQGQGLGFRGQGLDLHVVLDVTAMSSGRGTHSLPRKGYGAELRAGVVGQMLWACRVRWRPVVERRRHSPREHLGCVASHEVPPPAALPLPRRARRPTARRNGASQRHRPAAAAITR